LLVSEFHLDGYNFLSGLEDQAVKEDCYFILHLALRCLLLICQKHFMNVFFFCLRQGLVNKFLLCNIYRSHNSSLINDKNLYDLLHHIEQNFSVPKLIVGNFNFSNIDWYPVTGIGASAKCVALSDNEMAFVNSLRENLLFQHVVYPTRQWGTDTTYFGFSYNF